MERARTIAVVLDRDRPAAAHVVRERVPLAGPRRELEPIIVKPNARHLHVFARVVPVEPRCRSDILRPPAGLGCSPHSNLYLGGAKFAQSPFEEEKEKEKVPLCSISPHTISENNFGLCTHRHANPLVDPGVPAFNNARVRPKSNQSVHRRPIDAVAGVSSEGVRLEEATLLEAQAVCLIAAPHHKEVTRRGLVDHVAPDLRKVEQSVNQSTCQSIHESIDLSRSEARARWLPLGGLKKGRVPNRGVCWSSCMAENNRGMIARGRGSA